MTCPEDGQYAHKLATESIRGILSSSSRSYRLDRERRGISLYIPCWRRRFQMLKYQARIASCRALCDTAVLSEHEYECW